MGAARNNESSPLQIVLGSLASNSLSGYNDSKSSTLSTTQPHPSAIHILGTSYFASPRLAALQSPVKKLNKDGRIYMEDRKGPFDHFRPRSLLVSTARVTSINTATALSTFFSDQLNYEQKNEELVDSGKITPREADKLNEEWERREWDKRVEALPGKIGWALLRFHACTGIMRFYEFVMGRYILKVDVASRALVGDGGVGGTNSTGPSDSAFETMDKLTRDPFLSSKRTAQILQNEANILGKVTSSTGTETTAQRELMRRMFSTCLWANIIPFLAELTVQQGVLMYGYGVYYLEKKRRMRSREHNQKLAGDLDLEEESKDTETGPVNNEWDENEDSDKVVHESAYALSFFFQSTRLSIAKCLGWISASAGGAVGSGIYPGWGAVFGTQIGDTVVGALIE
mmetsp:Transcript_10851/g.22957  ORF Transcript_10851/g.22957 Transcript_10851/m.22957 type:complete len:400 (-) Transcript_10851:192-1391(-)